jgi:hypothetical protein
MKTVPKEWYNILLENFNAHFSTTGKLLENEVFHHI